eukprot:COSAG02_NODE_49917_length_324_cov_0.404444_1_plen_57_part_10
MSPDALVSDMLPSTTEMTGAQVERTFALLKKLDAAGFVHPYTDGMQSPISTLALWMK